MNSVFPIKKSELGKFIPMCLLFFLLLLVRNLLRNVKDALVATEIGTESISFTTIFLHVPLAFIALKWYNNSLYSSKSLEKTFRKSVLWLAGFYAVFAIFLFPYKYLLQPSEELVEKYFLLYPNLKWFLLIWANWTVALFAVISELWAIILCSIAYWQMANQITSISEASRFYIFFSSFGQINLIFSGIIVAYLSSPYNCLTSSLFSGMEANESFVKSLIYPCLILCGLCFLLHKYLEKNVVKNPKYNSDFSTRSYVSSKTKMGLIDSVKFVFSSSYFRMLCILTFSYSAIMTWSDGIITCMVKRFYTTPNDICIFKSKVLFYTGVVTILFSLLGTYLLKRFGWGIVTMFIPSIVLVSGSIFFFFAYGNIHYGLFSTYCVVFFAGVYAILTKGIKYSLFDSTKEMTYVPLAPEVKQAGEGSVDVVGDNIGKVLGSGLQLVAFTLFPSVKHEDLVGTLGLLCFFTGLLWIYAVFNLSKQYNFIVNNKNS